MRTEAQPSQMRLSGQTYLNALEKETFAIGVMSLKGLAHWFSANAAIKLFVLAALTGVPHGLAKVGLANVIVSAQ